MRRLLVDTSGWLALLNVAETSPVRAGDIYRKRFSASWQIVTHDGILLEVGNSLSSQQWRNNVIAWRERVTSSERVLVVSLNETLLAKGWNLFAARKDKDWGIIDCLSFIVMQEHEIREALTADKHFAQAGFTRLL